MSVTYTPVARLSFGKELCRIDDANHKFLKTSSDKDKESGNYVRALDKTRHKARESVVVDSKIGSEQKTIVEAGSRTVTFSESSEEPYTRKRPSRK